MSDVEMEAVIIEFSIARRLAHESAEATEAQRKANDSLQSSLQTLATKIQTNDLNRLIARLDRFRELRNEMEQGSFKITVDRELEKLWDKIK